MDRFTFFGLAALLCAGCFEKRQDRFSCGDQGVVEKGESNWVFLVDSTLGYKIITRYPISVSAEVFDSEMEPLNDFGFDIDSQQFSELPIYQDRFRALGVSWDNMKKDGTPFEGGCYKVQFTITAPTVNLLPDDRPSSNKVAVVLEIAKSVYPIPK